MGRVCVGRLCYGPSLQWAEFALGRDVQLPMHVTIDFGPETFRERHRRLKIDFCSPE